LSGSIPSEFQNLTNLEAGELYFNNNALYTLDDTLHGGDWESSQTVSPTNLAPATPDETSVPLTWTAITYTGDTGGYEVYYATTSGGPYTSFGTSTDKSATEITVTGLKPDTTYYFRVRTKTDPHANNQNTVYSEYTAEVSATTVEAGPSPVITSISPNHGSISGGTNITIIGENFDSATTVTIGGNPAVNLIFVSDIQVTCQVPAYATAGAADIVVTNPNGQSATVTDGYTYDSDINAGLIAYYPFNGNANDESRNGHDGTINGDPEFVDGLEGKGLKFDGDGDYIQVELVDSLKFNPNFDSFTLVAWAKPIGANNPAGPTHCNMSTVPFIDSYTYYLNNKSATGKRNAHTHEGGVSMGSPLWDQDDWHLFVGIWDVQGTEITASYYLDGNLEDQENFETVPDGSYPWHGLYIGATRHCSKGLAFGEFYGDEIRIYNRAISPDEIQELYSQPVLSATPESRSVSYTAGTSDFRVSNTGTGAMDWSALSNDSWLTITDGASGTDEGTISLSFASNTGTARTGTLTLSSPDALNSPLTLEVNQDEYVDTTPPVPPDGAWTEPAAGCSGENLMGVWSSLSGMMVAVGQSGTILKLVDETNCTAMKSTTRKTLSDVWGSSEQDIFAVGNDDTILHYDGNAELQWQRMSVDNFHHILMGVWGSSGSDVFAVSLNGAILHYDGSEWSEMMGGSPNIFMDVWGRGGSDVFAVGSTVFHYDGTVWTEAETGTSDLLMSVWGYEGSRDVFAAGQNGTILHYDGTSWTAMESGTTEIFKALWGNSPIDVFAMTENGTLFHYNGIAWSQLAEGVAGKTLEDVWRSSETEVVAAGQNGTILRLNTDDSQECPGGVCHVAKSGSDDDGNGSLIKPFASIQHAIETAASGYIVLVKPGTYDENIDFKGKNLTAASLYYTTGDPEYIAQTVIDGRGAGNAATFENGEGEAAALKGFTLINGSNGVYVKDATPRLGNLIIRDSGDSGIYCENAGPRVMSVSIVDSINAGIFCAEGADPSLSNSLLWNTGAEIVFKSEGEENSISIAHSDIRGAQAGIRTNDNGSANWGAGNIAYDPVFVDPENGDFQLANNSPCIGRGSADAVPDEEAPRSDPAGSDPDMGALENPLGEADDDTTKSVVFENSFSSENAVSENNLAEISGTPVFDAEKGAALDSAEDRIRFENILGNAFPDAGKIEFDWIPAHDENASDTDGDISERTVFFIANDETPLKFAFDMRYRGTEDAADLTTVEMKAYDEDPGDYVYAHVYYDLDFVAGQSLHVSITWDKTLGDSPLRLHIDTTEAIPVSEVVKNPAQVIENIQGLFGTLEYGLELLKASDTDAPFDADMYVSDFSIWTHVKNLYVDTASEGTEKGTPNAPFKTLAEVIENAMPNSTIRIAQGEYHSEVLLIEDIHGLKIEGGWENKDGIWTREEEIDPNSTLILAKDETSLDPIFNLTNATDTLIDSLAIQNGVVAESSDGLEVSNNFIAGVTPLEIKNSEEVNVIGNRLIGLSENEDAGYGMVVRDSSVNTEANVIRADTAGIHCVGDSSGLITLNAVHVRNTLMSACAIKLDITPDDAGTGDDADPDATATGRAEGIEIINNALYVETLAGIEVIGIEEVGISSTPSKFLKNALYGDRNFIIYRNGNTAIGLTDADTSETYVEYITMFDMDENGLSSGRIKDEPFTDISEENIGGNYYHEIDPYNPCDGTSAEEEDNADDGTPDASDVPDDSADSEEEEPCVHIVSFPKPVSSEDRDFDGMPDDWEVKYFGNTLRDGNEDYDDDDLIDRNEYRHGTNPKNWDTEDDGMRDGWEVRYRLSPLLKDAMEDPDRDGYINLHEHNGDNSPMDSGSYPKFCPEGGIFEAGKGMTPESADTEPGLVWLVFNAVYDGGNYQGEVGIFSLDGMKELASNLNDFIKEAARRVLSNSEEGHLVFSDQEEGAQFGGILGEELDDWNGGAYKGMKRFQMRVGDEFAVVLIPNGTFEELYEDPTIKQKAPGKHPFFSFASPNSDHGSHVVRISDINPSLGEGAEGGDVINDGSGLTFVFEDLIFTNSDMDYNDLIFQIAGVESETSHKFVSLLKEPEVCGCEDETEGSPGTDGDANAETGDDEDASCQNIPPVPEEIIDAFLSGEVGKAIYNHLDAQIADEDTAWMRVVLEGDADLMIYDPYENECGREGCYIPGANFEFDAEGQQVISLIGPEEGTYRIIVRRQSDAERVYLKVEGHQGETEIPIQEKEGVFDSCSKMLKADLEVSFTAASDDGETPSFFRLNEPEPTHKASQVPESEETPATGADAEMPAPEEEASEPGAVLCFDFNGDGKINNFDISKIASRLDIRSSHQDYDPFYDFDLDGRIEYEEIIEVITSWYDPDVAEE